MEFPAKISRKNSVTIPKKTMERMSLQPGQMVDVSISIIPDDAKDNVDKPWRNR